MEPQLGLVQPQTTDLGQDELAAVEKLQQGYHNMRAELGKVIVGQDAVIEELLIALFCRGHTLLVGVPGLALLAADFDLILVVVALVSTLAGAAGGWTAGVGYARAGGDEMLPPGAAARAK